MIGQIRYTAGKDAVVVTEKVKHDDQSNPGTTKLVNVVEYRT